MDPITFPVMAAAIAAGNLFSFGIVWAVFQIAKSEKTGGEARTPHLVVLLFCLFFVGGGVYLAL